MVRHRFQLALAMAKQWPTGSTVMIALLILILLVLIIIFKT